MLILHYIEKNLEIINKKKKKKESEKIHFMSQKLFNQIVLISPLMSRSFSSTSAAARTVERKVSSATARDWRQYRPEGPIKKEFSPLFTQFHKWDGTKKHLSSRNVSQNPMDLESNIFARALSTPLRCEKISKKIVFPKAFLLKFSLGRGSDKPSTGTKDDDIWVIPNLRNEKTNSSSSYILNSMPFFIQHIKRKNIFIPITYLTSKITVTTMDKIKWNLDNAQLINKMYVELLLEQLGQIRVSLESFKAEYAAAKASQDDKLYSAIQVDEHNHFGVFKNEVSENEVDQLIQTQQEKIRHDKALLIGNNVESLKNDDNSMIALDEKAGLSTEEYYASLSTPTTPEELGVHRKQRELIDEDYTSRPKIRLFCLYGGFKITQKILETSLECYDKLFQPFDPTEVQESIQFEQNALAPEDPDSLTLDILSQHYQRMLYVDDQYEDAYLDETQLHYATAYIPSTVDLVYDDSISYIHDDALNFLEQHPETVQEVESTIVPFSLAAESGLSNTAVNDPANKIEIPAIGTFESAIYPGSRNSVLINFKEGDYEHDFEIINGVLKINMARINITAPGYDVFLKQFKSMIFEDEMMIIPSDTKKVRKFLDTFLKFLQYNRSQ